MRNRSQSDATHSTKRVHTKTLLGVTPSHKRPRHYLCRKYKICDGSVAWRGGGLSGCLRGDAVLHSGRILDDVILSFGAQDFVNRPYGRHANARDLARGVEGFNRRLGGNGDT